MLFLFYLDICTVDYSFCLIKFCTYLAIKMNNTYFGLLYLTLIFLLTIIVTEPFLVVVV